MSIPNLRPESVDLLRRMFSGQKTPWSADISADIFFQETAAQGMAPLLFRKISKQDCSDWPPDLLARLKETALRQAAAELLLEADLRALLHAFADAGIEPLLLKGTALAYSLYPEPWLRPRCDTDLLVAEAEREKAAALLQGMGYETLLEENMDYVSAQKSYSKTGPGIRFSYDLHWQISNTNRQFSRSFADEHLFAAAVSVPSLGEHARTLSKIDSLLYACFHRAGHFSHSGDRLIWLHDIHLLCQSLTEAEAETFCAKARRLEIRALCADAIAVSKSWFSTKLPEQLATLMEAKTNNETFAALLKPGGRQVGIKHHALLELRALPTWRERIRFLFQNAFPPPEFMRWRYSETSPLPLLYLKRFAEALYIFLKR
ncbi:nucleotidyltransferase family protein [Candidatus Electronema sp. JC]|uniref:nucleotidyltransferase domain-containing protein n=1 Tax=Candidatus Electronema sp. JC TaxID=3401570 RepID=UPI003B432170